MPDKLKIADQSFGSRLLLGTSGYPNRQVMLDALEAGGAELVTVSVRRISLEGYAESMVDLLGGDYRLLPNTAGCATVRDAVLTAQLAREALDTNWIKLELIGDRETLYPDVEHLLTLQGSELDAALDEVMPALYESSEEGAVTNIEGVADLIRGEAEMARETIREEIAWAQQSHRDDKVEQGQRRLVTVDEREHERLEALRARDEISVSEARKAVLLQREALWDGLRSHVESSSMSGPAITEIPPGPRFTQGTTDP